MTQWLGDYKEDETVYFLWSTNDRSGASITRATDGEVRVYKDNNVAQSTAGITDTEDFDSLTGIHACTIDLSADAFYATGADYAVVLAGAVIDGETVNAVLAHFSIENRFDEVDVVKISGDSAAADNAEKVFDNTGYDMSNSKVGEATTLSSAERTNIADEFLKRDWTSVVGEASRSALNALRFMRNKWDVALGTLVVCKEDDSTIAWQGTVTTDASANPVSGVDPA